MVLAQPDHAITPPVHAKDAAKIATTTINWKTFLVAMVILSFYKFENKNWAQNKD
jgi:hypothetical protein